MEKRLLLAVTLSFLVVIIFNAYFGPKPPKKPQPDETSQVDENGTDPSGENGEEAETGEEETEAEAPSETDEGDETEEGEEAEEEEETEEEAGPGEDRLAEFEASVQPNHAIEIGGGEYYESLHFTSRGAGLTSVYLKEYLQPDREGPRHLIQALNDRHASLALATTAEKNLVRAEWASEVLPDGKGVVFTRPLRNGLELSKTFRLAKEGAYLLTLEVAIRNPGKTDLPFQYDLHGFVGITSETEHRGGGIYGVAGLEQKGRVENYISHYASDLSGEDAAEEVMTAPLGYGGVVNKYFAAVTWPEKTDRLESFRLRGFTPKTKKHRPNATSLIRTRTIPIPAGKTVTDTFHLFIGPKKKEVLASYGDRNLSLLLDFGWFGFFSRFLLVILHGIQSLTGSFGIAIILLTFLVRGCIHPLSSKSQRSMMKMSELKPHVDAIREKYEGKEGKEQEMQMEIWELYKEHGANPLSGCLPLFLQAPILFGLYMGILYDIELRQATFLYITDLSEPDRLSTLPFTIPILDTNDFNLLPILMMVVMVLQQRLRPSTGDPQQDSQKKMMSFMFIFMGFIFYNISSGLVLYFLTSYAVGILEQLFIQKKLAAEKAESDAAPA